MKTLLTICMAMLCTYSYSQDIDKNRRDYSPFGYDYAHLSFGMRELARHGDATQITYFDLNFVEGLMQDFMKRQMGMTIDNVSKFIKQGEYQTFTVSYAQMATMGGKVPHLYLKYTIFDNKDKNPIIKALSITGNSDKVIYFFVSYWPTNLNIDVQKSKIAYSYLIQDKATIKFNPANSQWSIVVDNTTIHSLPDYYVALSKGTDSNIKIETEYSIKQKEKRDSEIAIIVRNAHIRDSLFKLAHDLNIAYSDKKDDLNPSTDWLQFAITNEQNRLNSGKNYNRSNIDTLLALLNKSMPLDKDTFISGKLTFKINPNGVIDKVEVDGTITITKEFINSINMIVAGKKTNPFVVNNVAYPSYKKYSIMFIPKAMLAYKITEQGDR